MQTRPRTAAAPDLMAVLGGKSRSEQGMSSAGGGAGGSPNYPSGCGGSGGGSPANSQMASALPGTSLGSGESRGGSRGGSRRAEAAAGATAGAAAQAPAAMSSDLWRPAALGQRRRQWVGRRSQARASSQPALQLSLPLALKGGGSTGGGLGSGCRWEGSASSISVMLSWNDSREAKDRSSRPADAAGGAFTGRISDSLTHPTLAGGVVSAGAAAGVGRAGVSRRAEWWTRRAAGRLGFGPWTWTRSPPCRRPGRYICGTGNRRQDGLGLVLLEPGWLTCSSLNLEHSGAQ